MNPLPRSPVNLPVKIQPPPAPPVEPSTEGQPLAPEERLFGNEPTEAVPKVVPNGTWTMKSPAGNHRTLRVRTVLSEGDLRGSRILGLLVGPDNERDYRAFGFVLSDGVCVWKRFRSEAGREQPHVDGYRWNEKWNDYEKIAHILLSLLTRPGGGHFGGEGYTVEGEKKCLRCNRKLTTPDSLERGVGPECAGKAG